MPRENTIPEQLCQKMLDELHIAYLDHKRVGSVCQPDFIIPRRKIAIFVDGDFWHCNPEVYPDGPMCETQRRVTTKDRRQESRLRELGWQILRLWEKDLKTHPEMCKGRIWSVIGAES
jgi:DNA mismatch endonuclease (patch repair protein)